MLGKELFIFRLFIFKFLIEHLSFSLLDFFEQSVDQIRASLSLSDENCDDFKGIWIMSIYSSSCFFERRSSSAWERFTSAKGEINYKHLLSRETVGHFFLLYESFSHISKRKRQTGKLVGIKIIFRIKF